MLRPKFGSHFVNSVIREFLHLVGTEHCLTLAYSKEENSLVERANKELNRHLKAFTFDKSTVDDYRHALPMVQRIMNATYSERTKLSPSHLLFGNAINLDRGIIRPHIGAVEGVPPLSDYIQNLIKVQDKVISIAKKNIIFADDAHMAQYPAERTEYAPNSYVLVIYREVSAPTQLHTQWKGPLKVLSGSNSKYILLDLITNKEKEYHVHHMKPFFFNPLSTNPIDVASRDYLEHVLEAIIDHKRNKRSRRPDLEFLCKWQGYDDDFNTWEPFANVRDTQVFHDYLVLHGMLKFIPPKFR